MSEGQVEQKWHRKAKQSFALTAAAHTFTPRDISRLSEDEAYRRFLTYRFKATDGKPQCPRCDGVVCYEYRARRIFKCKSCKSQFSATTKTEYASRKLSFRQILELIVEFALPAKGISAIDVSKNLNISYRTAFYRLHGLRRAMQRSQEDTVFDTPVEIDGAEFGGYIKPKNVSLDRKDLRKIPYHSSKKQVVGIVRERRVGGRSRVVVAKSEKEAAKLMPPLIKPGTRIYADSGRAFHFMKADYPMRRIKHSLEYWNPTASTNNAECFFSMLRRAERGIYHHIAGRHLAVYAAEMAWRQDRRRVDTKNVFEGLCGHAVTALTSSVKIDEAIHTR